eukprot:334965-Amphidinium_carterae.1
MLTNSRVGSSIKGLVLFCQPPRIWQSYLPAPHRIALGSAQSNKSLKLCYHHVTTGTDCLSMTSSSPDVHLIMHD